MRRTSKFVHPFVVSAGATAALLLSSIALGATAPASQPGTALDIPPSLRSYFLPPSNNPTDRPFLPFGTDAFPIPPSITQVQVPPGAIALLTQAFQQAQGPERMGYLTELGRCGDAALPAVLAHLNAADPIERETAVQAVGAIGNPSATSPLAALLTDSDPNVRRSAVLALKRIGSAATITPALTDADPAVRQAAFDAAATPEQAAAIAGQIPSLPPALLPHALRALGRSHAKTFADAVSQCSENPDPAVRYAAIEALGELKAATQHSTVEKHLSDPFPAVRRAAVLAMLGTAPLDQLQARAIAALADPDVTVRQAAAIVLQQAPTDPALQPLLAQLGSHYPPLHNAALEALAAMGPQVSTAAVALCNSASAREQIDGCVLLGRLKETAATDRRIALLNSPDWRVVAAAARSLVNAPPSAEAVGPRLLAILAQHDHPSSSPRAALDDATVAAILLCGRCRYAPAIPQLLPMIPVGPQAHAPTEEMRLAAIWAVGMMASPATPAAREVAEVHESSFEGDRAAFESLKALINIRDFAAVDQFRGWSSDGSISRDNACRWIARLGCILATGTAAPFSPIVTSQALPLSVSTLNR